MTSLPKRTIYTRRRKSTPPLLCPDVSWEPYESLVNKWKEGLETLLITGRIDIFITRGRRHFNLYPVHGIDHTLGSRQHIFNPNYSVI